MKKLVKWLVMGVGLVVLSGLVVMTAVYVLFIDVVLTPDHVRHYLTTEYDSSSQVVQVRAKVGTSAPVHIYDVRIKQKGNRVIVKAYTSMLDMEISDKDRKIDLDIPIEVGDSIDYIQLGSRKKDVIWSRDKE
jgi:hypothetical protein